MNRRNTTLSGSPTAAGALPAGSVLAFQDVAVEFATPRGPLLAVEDVSFSVEGQHFVCLLGPSGCGKSTLLNLAAGLASPTRGLVRLFGQPSTGPHSKVGLVPQADNLFPWRTLRRNVEFGLEVQKASKDDRRRRALELIEQVGLEGFEDAYPDELSGGMRQRANIARTLAVDPDVLLMDEPFGALDALTRAELQSMLQDLWTDYQKTVLFVTHDLTEAITLGDRVVVLTPRPGRIQRSIDVPLDRPRDPLHIQEHPGFAQIHAELANAIFIDPDRQTRPEKASDHG